MNITILLLLFSTILALDNERSRILATVKSNSSPFPGVDMTFGYINLNNKSDDKIFYTFTKNKSGIKDAPVLIMNPGGPGANPSWLLTTPTGPLQYSEDKGTLIPNPKPNFTDNCDVLIPDIIAGSGFSTTNIEVDMTKSAEEIFTETADFFIKLDKQRPELMLKKRNLIFYGISYGTALFPWIAKYLFERGFTIAGVILDSPFLSPYHMMQKWPEVVKGFIPVEGSKTYDHQVAISKHCAKMIKDKVKWTIAKGVLCVQLFDDPTMKIFIDPKTKDFVANSYDMRSDPKKNQWSSYFHGKIKNLGARNDDITKFWATERSKKAFNAQKIPKFIDYQVSDYQELAHMDFNQMFDAFDYQCNKGINITIMVGHNDGVTGPIMTKAWMEESKCLKKMKKKMWQKTKRGNNNRRYGKNVEYEIYKKAGHFVALNDPKAMLDKINEMVSKIGKSLND